MTLSTLLSDSTPIQVGYSGGASPMHYIRRWTHNQSPSEGDSAVQVICRADPAEWVFAGNAELLRAGWVQAPMMTVLQACRDAGPDYAWVGFSTTLAIVELKSSPSIFELLEQIYKMATTSLIGRSFETIDCPI
jgi:hypothetical protein